jgi:predicted lipoprotein with Yx(FWY)xxD motif
MRFLKTLAVVACLVVAAGAVAAWASGPAELKIEKTKIGKVVANVKLHTLYMFRADKGTKSACYGKCAKFWPPLLTSGKPKAGPGIKASLLGTSKRKDGKLQVTYKGHPLYTFLEDKAPAQTKGEGSKAFGAGWYALTPSGVVIDRD